MNCLEFRRIVGAQPDIATPEIVAHAAQCAACARYRLELQQMDQLIHRALKIDTRSGASTQRMSGRARSMRWGLAASVLAAVLAGLTLWVAYPRATLAEQVIEHAQGEESAMVRTSDVADPARVADILARSGVRMKPNAVAVSYAQSCLFRMHLVPHLVVQTDRGPVPVLLLANDKSQSNPQTFSEGGYQGVIVPAPRGVLAVLGHSVPVEEIAAKVLAAVDYSG